MCLKKVRDIKKGEGDDEKRKAGWEAETTFRTTGRNPITNYVREFSHFYLPCKFAVFSGKIALVINSTNPTLNSVSPTVKQKN